MKGNNIRKLRQEHRWTHEEIVNRMGVCRMALGNYERETWALGIDLLIQLADIFNTTIDALVGRKEKSPGPTDSGLLFIRNVYGFIFISLF